MRRELTPFVKWLEQDKPNCTPEDVTPSGTRRWIIHRRSSGISSYTLHGNYRNPKIFWTWLVKEELAEKNPCLKMDPPRVDKVMKPDLNVEEVQCLFAACQGRD